MKFFVPISKIDVVQRMVYGVAAAEQVDKANEILDYESSKPNFLKWSEGIAKATDGKSVGNVRAMHQKIAAGKLTEFACNDEARRFDVAAKVVDDNEWEKVAEGVYTGFSIGGAYIRTWDDPTLKGVKRYTADPNEISLVDNPCIPGATFTAIKADGSAELRKFAGDVEENSLRKINAEDITVGADPAEANGLRKCMWDISRLSDTITTLVSIQFCLQNEAEYEKDGSSIPADLKAAIQTLSGLLVQLAQEETGELAAAMKAAESELTKEASEMAMKLAKVIEAVQGATSLEEVQKVASHLKVIGSHVDKIAKCHGDMAKSIAVLQGTADEDGEEKKPEGEGAEKAPDGNEDIKDRNAGAKFAELGDLQKAASDRLSKVETDIADTRGAIAHLASMMERILQIPTPTKVAKTEVAAVTKVQDNGGSAAESAKNPEDAIKFAHAQGMTRVILK